MWNWIKNQSPSVKVMLIIGLVCIAGIIWRWDYVSSQTGESFRNIFSPRAEEVITPREQAESNAPVDSMKMGGDSIR